jgi:hypothetical protein
LWDVIIYQWVRQALAFTKDEMSKFTEIGVVIDKKVEAASLIVPKSVSVDLIQD